MRLWVGAFLQRIRVKVVDGNLDVAWSCLAAPGRPIDGLAVVLENGPVEVARSDCCLLLLLAEGKSCILNS
jgi:hypothetical protein